MTWPFRGRRSYRYAFDVMVGFLVVVGAGLTTILILPRYFESTATIVLHPTAVGERSEETPQAAPVDENAMQSEIDAIGSADLLTILVRRLELGHDGEFAPVAGWSARMRVWLTPVEPSDPRRALDQIRTRLRKHMTITRDRRSYTVKIAFRSVDPAKAARLAQTLLAAYGDTQVARRRAVLERRSSWMSERVAALRLNAERSQAALATFLVASGLVDTSTDLALKNQITSISNDLAQVKVRAIEADTRCETLERLQASGALDGAPEIVASTTIVHLKDALAAALAKPAAWAPESQALSTQIAAESAHIVDAARAEAASLAVRERRLQDKLVELSAVVLSRDRDGLRLATLRRDADGDRLAFDDALARLRVDTAKTTALDVGFDVVEEPEIHRNPVSPDVELDVLVTLLAGIGAGAALAWRRWRHDGQSRPIFVLAVRAEAGPGHGAAVLAHAVADRSVSR